MSVSPLSNRPIITLLAAAIIPFLATGCELFVIGKSSSEIPIERNQRSALGVVYLWKAELDSSNLTAATELMRHPSGRHYLALERYELADDIRHWQGIIGKKPITSTKIDTVSKTHHVVHTKVDYIKDVTFNTISVGDVWYISTVR